MPKSSTFDQTVRQIVEMRQKNPAMVIKHRLSLDPATVGNELEAFTKRRLGIVDPVSALPASSIPGVSSTMISTVPDIKRLALGTAVMLAWERSSQPPVDRSEASRRGNICAICPLNSTSKLEEWRKSPVGRSAEAKLKRISKDAHLLKTELPLGLCTGLFAPCHLLCSEPRDLIGTRVKPSDLSETPAECWIRA